MAPPASDRIRHNSCRRICLVVTKEAEIAKKHKRLKPRYASLILPTNHPNNQTKNEPILARAEQSNNF